MSSIFSKATQPVDFIKPNVFKVLRYLSYYLNVTESLIISLIFIFLSCREKAHDNKEFNHENLRPRRESRITTTR